MNLADIFMKGDKDVAHFESVRDQMVMPQESLYLPIKANSQGVLEQRLDEFNYESLTQLSKRKEKRNDDVSITDATVDTDSDTDNDTDNNTDNDTSNQKMTQNEHGL